VIVSVSFDVADQLLFSYFAFVRYWDFKKAYDSQMMEVLYNILIEFGVPMKLFRLIKMCLNETYSKVCISKHLADTFHIQNGL
jgi:hypothetical protein